MINKLNVGDVATAGIVGSTKSETSFKFNNPVYVECVDVNGITVWSDYGLNTMTDEGLNNILDVYFSDGTQSNTHYVGLSKASVSAGTTLSSGLSEFTGYTGNRQTWVEAGVSSKTISNSASEAQFPITASGTVTGAFITNVATGTSGVLVCGIDFSAVRNVVSGDTLKVIYTLTVANS